MAFLLRNIKLNYEITRTIFTTSKLTDQHFQLIVAGGGTAGIPLAYKFRNKVKTIALIEPSNHHFYQPLWTLVGAGIKSYEESYFPTEKFISSKVQWFKKHVDEFDPDKNKITLRSGEKLTYDFLIVAIGIQLRYDLIPGAIDALKNDNRVVSNYSKDFVKKTFDAYKNFTNGTALFSFPNTPVKCAGAPQKVMYLFDDYLTRNGLREKADIQYFTSLPTVFSVKKYSDKLEVLCKNRNLKVTTRSHLFEVDPLKSTATFENIDTQNKTIIKYDFLHITPPMTGYDVIKSSKLSDSNGFVEVNKENLQHVKYPNVFALGDCSNLPTSKTAAAIASQQNVVHCNLSSVMTGLPSKMSKYDGYTSCPFVTGYDRGILAEFGYDGKLMETFPFDQSEESKFVFALKNMLPDLYWKMYLRGHWNGPTVFRNMLSIFKFK